MHKLGLNTRSGASPLKGRTTWADDFGFERASRLKTSKTDFSPWRTSENSWRAKSAPFLWAEQMEREKAEAAAAAAAAAADKLHSEEEEDPFARHRKDLNDMIKNSKNINKFYIPISQLPPIGPDPRYRLAGKPPSCAPRLSVPRATRIMQRWQSMPRLRSQLPPESLRTIEAAAKNSSDGPRAADSRPAWHTTANARSLGSPGRKAYLSPGRRPSICDSEGQVSLRREDTDYRLARAFLETEDGSARGKKENPYIACTCCDHQTPRPWMQSDGGMSARAISRSPSAPNTGRVSGRRKSSGFCAVHYNVAANRKAAEVSSDSRMSGGKPSITFAT